MCLFFKSIRSYNYITDCGGHLLGQSFASCGCGRCLLQDEDHSGSRPHSFPGSCHMRFGTYLEWPWISWFMRKPSRRAKLPNIRFSVLLNSWDNFFVTLPLISCKTSVMYPSCELGTFEFCAKLLLGCFSQFSLFNVANFFLFLRNTIFYRKKIVSD